MVLHPCIKIKPLIVFQLSGQKEPIKITDIVTTYIMSLNPVKEKKHTNIWTHGDFFFGSRIF